MKLREFQVSVIEHSYFSIQVTNRFVYDSMHGNNEATDGNGRNIHFDNIYKLALSICYGVLKSRMQISTYQTVMPENISEQNYLKMNLNYRFDACSALLHNFDINRFAITYLLLFYLSCCTFSQN